MTNPPEQPPTIPDPGTPHNEFDETPEDEAIWKDVWANIAENGYDSLVDGF